MKVKKLKWIHNRDRAEAGAIRFRYIVGETDLGSWWLVAHHPGEEVDIFGGTIEDAKCAAQADFERRVMEYIEPGVSQA